MKETADDESPPPSLPSPDDGLLGWDFEGTARHHLEQGLRMTPLERLRWLEGTVDEMQRLLGLAQRTDR